jgi:hypothetical protein
MKAMILVALISSSLLSSWMPANQSHAARSLTPAPFPALADRVSLVTPRQLVMPRRLVVGHRNCVGVPHRAPASSPALGPVMVVTSELLTWA